MVGVPVVQHITQPRTPVHPAVQSSAQRDLSPENPVLRTRRSPCGPVRVTGPDEPAPAAGARISGGRARPDDEPPPDEPPEEPPLDPPDEPSDYEPLPDEPPEANPSVRGATGAAVGRRPAGRGVATRRAAT